MTDANFHVFGMGRGIHDLHYIGWTERPLCDEQDIFSDLAKNSSEDIAHWVEGCVDCGQISIFEIESAPSVQDAKDTVQFWCQYYGMLGARVVSDPA